MVSVSKPNFHNKNFLPPFLKEPFWTSGLLSNIALAISGLALGVAGFYLAALRGQPPGPWLHATLGVLMMLIVVAMSRISMRIVNNAIDESTANGEAATVDYRARPPRRNLAIFCIGLYTLIELVMPGSRISGSLALATAAALLNLLNDWHVGRALLRRWPLAADAL